MEKKKSKKFSIWRKEMKTVLTPTEVFFNFKKKKKTYSFNFFFCLFCNWLPPERTGPLEISLSSLAGCQLRGCFLYMLHGIKVSWEWNAVSVNLPNPTSSDLLTKTRLKDSKLWMLKNSNKSKEFLSFTAVNVYKNTTKDILKIC